MQKTRLQTYSLLKKYFVNLDARLDRLEQTYSQVGDDFIRVAAVNGTVANYQLIDLMFDQTRCNKKYGINQGKKQAASCISQYRIYQNVVNNPDIAEDDFVLIAEDDNNYIVDFKEKLNQLLQFVQQPRFSNIELVILKYMEISEQIDYAPYLPLVNKDKEWIYESDGQEHNINPQALEVLRRYHWGGYIHTTPENIFSFNYTNVTPSDNPNLYSDTQHLFVPKYIRPYSASLYLIRKSACRRILRQNPKPWWYTDDFKQIVNVQNMLVASPFLANETVTAAQSSIVDEVAALNFHYNRINNSIDLYRFKTLDKLKFLVSMNTSESAASRKISSLIQKVLWLKY